MPFAELFAAFLLTSSPAVVPQSGPQISMRSAPQISTHNMRIGWRIDNIDGACSARRYGNDRLMFDLRVFPSGLVEMRLPTNTPAVWADGRDDVNVRFFQSHEGGSSWRYFDSPLTQGDNYVSAQLREPQPNAPGRLAAVRRFIREFGQSPRIGFYNGDQHITTFLVPANISDAAEDLQGCITALENGEDY